MHGEEVSWLGCHPLSVGHNFAIPDTWVNWGEDCTVSSKAIARGCDERCIHSLLMPDLLLKHFWPDSSTRSCPPSPEWSKPDFHFCRVGADGNEMWLGRPGSLWEADRNQYEHWRTYLEKTQRFQWAMDKDVPPLCSSLALMNPSPSRFTWCQALFPALSL